MWPLPPRLMLVGTGSTRGPGSGSAAHRLLCPFRTRMIESPAASATRTWPFSASSAYGLLSICSPSGLWFSSNALMLAMIRFGPPGRATSSLPSWRPLTPGGRACGGAYVIAAR